MKCPLATDGDCRPPIYDPRAAAAYDARGAPRRIVPLVTREKLSKATRFDTSTGTGYRCLRDDFLSPEELATWRERVDDAVVRHP